MRSAPISEALYIVVMQNSAVTLPSLQSWWRESAVNALNSNRREEAGGD